MKSSQIAAAVLATLATTAANAYVEKTMCVPAQVIDGRINILSLCDASELNKKYSLKVDDSECAVSGQSFEAGNGYLWDQASVYIWAETKKALKKQMLPKCEEYDAAAYAVEL